MTNNGLIALIVVASVMALIGYMLSRLSAPPAQSADKAAPEKTKTDDNQATPTRSPNTESDTLEESSERPVAQLIEEVNRRLPQTQCAQCGHPGCRPYAEAIIRDNAPINQCPPGGTALIDELAVLLGTDALPLDDNKGQTKPPQVAFIVEPDCIGCVLCIAACPVDAIVGAARYMHTVISDQCTGCELCLPPCPVDCIELHPLETPLHRWHWPKPS